jgi:hypothetical protein
MNMIAIAFSAALLVSACASGPHRPQVASAEKGCVLNLRGADAALFDNRTVNANRKDPSVCLSSTKIDHLRIAQAKSDDRRGRMVPLSN